MASVSIRERIARALVIRLTAVSGVVAVYRQDELIHNLATGHVLLMMGDEQVSDTEDGDNTVSRLLDIAAAVCIFRDESASAGSAVSDAAMNAWLAKLEDGLIGANPQLSEADIPELDPICYDIRVTGVAISDMQEQPAMPAVYAQVYYRTYRDDPYTAPAVGLLTE